ncbi:VCBS repeat-containing protein [Psychroflexus sp. YR1-1]|uniref:VCBS repeat-containing protein n=1 Tax=Psychroflexus aurantiacus TaxID=2709310 RepID=A0A6B3R1J5_9FLAO|nr:VCBS repeat-containing protein [Psychroflexus aurantiacus]NEV92907.1 VCBS repeat-containing protein [Psychroflexus aurantiacus]
MKITTRIKFNLILFFSTILFGSCSNNENFLFKEVSQEKSQVDFINRVTEDAEHSIINYIYYYNGGGVATGDVNGDDLPDLFFVANTGENKLYLNKGNLRFEDVSEQANIKGNASWNTGVSMVDINDDGLLDIYVCAVSGLLDFTGHNELFINNGDGTFTEDAKSYGLDFKGYSTQSYFFDYDKDGDLDVYIVNHAVHTNLSHGRAELRNERAPNVGDVLMRNDGGKFTDVSESANIFGGVNGYGLSATIADFNNDGWDDIYVCNDFHEDDYYYINNQDGTFDESLDEAFTTISRFSMGSDAADINADGFQDLMTLDMLPKEERLLKETEGDDAMFNMQAHLKTLGYKDQFSRNMLQINQKGNYFIETALLNEVADTDWSWAPLFADYNNDTHQDLFVSNGILRRPNSLDFKKYVSSAFKGRSENEGLKWLYNSIDKMPGGNVANEIFEGNSETFKSQTGNWIKNEPQLSNGAVYVDLDLDGDLDLVTNNFNQVASIFENSTNTKANYLNLKLDYKAGNSEGIGTKAMVYTNGKAQLKQLFKSRGFLSSVEAKLYFGLGKMTKVDSVQVIWPNHKYQVIIQPEINTTLTINYQEGGQIYDYAEHPEKNAPFQKVDLINFTHKEDNYNDFAEEKLIPYKVSTLGPAIAVADIDKNGFEDVFIGNAAGQPAQLFMNNGSDFEKSEQPAFTEDMDFEDNSAVWVDVDNDGDLDLYVTSGAHTNPRFKTDRLYINADGNFTKSEGRVPEDYFITSTVIACDYDGDGDQDLFVGNYSQLGNFGEMPDSYILKNDGEGQFEKDKDFQLSSKVTDAKWHDVNADGTKDLVITTEWDHPHIFLNNDGELREMQLPDELTGLWQTVDFFDIDKDGDEDILFGNWGLNTKFNLNFDGPLRMYHSDFDRNGVEESIIAYNNDGEYYPLNTKDELASQMNVMSKRFLDHESMAGKNIEEVMTRGSLSEAELYEVETLASGYLLNENGEFNRFIPFESDFQLAPISSFSELQVNAKNQLMVGGNSLRVNTYHGAYTALKGLLAEDKNTYDWVSEFGIEPFNKQVKDIKHLKMKAFRLLIVVFNDGELKTYSY